MFIYNPRCRAGGDGEESCNMGKAGERGATPLCAAEEKETDEEEGNRCGRTQM